jgi:hypothetical protein
MFALGMMGLLDPMRILIISSIGILLAVISPFTRKIIFSVPQKFRVVVRSFKNWWVDLPSWIQALSLGLMIVSTLRFAFLIISLPPFVWDSLTYHLTNVAEWTQRGKIELFDTSMVRIYTPANFETLTLWTTVFIHHDALIEMAGLPAYVLAAAAFYSICRSLEISRSSTWLATLAYILTPSLLIASTGTKNDPHMAAYYLSLLALILYALDRRRASPITTSFNLLVTSLLIFFLAFGTKAYLIHILPGLILIAFLGIRRQEGIARWRGYLNNVNDGWRDKRKVIKVLLVALVMSGVLIGLFWNVRNWVITGNPFYPYGVRVESTQVLEGADRDAMVSFTRLRMNIESLIWKFGDRQGRISPDLTDTTGWGWVVYGLGIPASLWGLLSRRDLRVLLAGFLVSLIVIFISIRPSPWNMRYLLWYPAVHLIALAAIFDEMKRWTPWIMRIFAVLIVVGMGFNFISVWNYGRISNEDFERMLALPIKERSSAALALNMPREYASSLEYVPTDVLLGYNVGENGFIYPLYRPDFSQDLVYIPVDVGASCEDVAGEMAQRGTRFLFTAPEHTEDQILSLLHNCGESGNVLRELGINLYVINDK